MIVIAGKNNIAVYAVNLLLHEHMIPANQIKIVCNKTESGVDSWQMSLRNHALLNGIEEVALEQAERCADIFISLEFDSLVKPERFKTNRLFNIHFSLLPKYKGMYTSIWPVLYADSVSGTTLHLIDSGIDTGDIIDQHSFELSTNDCSVDLYYKYIRSSQYLLKKNLKGLLNNEWQASPQPAMGSSYFSKRSLDFSRLEIELNNTAENISRQIKAFSFRPYQLPVINKNKCVNSIILDTKSKFKPGSVLRENELFFDVSTVDYDLRIFKDCRTELDRLLVDDCVNSLERLIDCLPSIEDKNENSWTPLMVACYNGSINVAQKLVTLGADVNAVNYKGTTPLMYAKDNALKTGRAEIISLLLDAGADYDCKDLMNKSVRDYTSGSEEWAQLIKQFDL